MRTRIRYGAILAALAALWAPASASAEDPKIEFEKYKLDNGLEIILHQDNTVPLVAVNVWYHVGSGNEEHGKSGFAHLFEHMMFQGTKHTGEDAHFAILKKIGASFINGTTNPDRTNYFEVVPSHQLEVALWLESDRMGYMLPLLTEKSFANQQEVVRNERRQNYDNRPYGKERFAVAAALYPEGHPYRYLTIGRHEDLANATVEDVKAFFNKWYVPANATIAIAGDIDVAETKKMVEKWFGSFPKADKPYTEPVPAPVLTETKRVTIEDNLAPLRRVRYVWHSPAFFAPGDAELDILADALGDSRTGRLFKILVHEKQLAQSVSVYQQSSQFSGSFNVVVDLKPTADMTEVERIVNGELKRVLSEPISHEELARAVLGIESRFVWGLEHVFSRSDVLQRYNHYTGDPGYLSKDLDRYRKSSPDKVMAVAKQVLMKNRAEIITMPAKKPQPRAKAEKGGK